MENIGKVTLDPVEVAGVVEAIAADTYNAAFINYQGRSRFQDMSVHGSV